MKFIGEHLIHHSKETAEFSAQRGFLDGFFPYVFVASRRMSLRAISRWLAEEFDIKITPVTLSLAMRDAEHYWRAIMERVAPSAMTLATFSGLSVDEILGDKEVFDRLRSEPVERFATFPAPSTWEQEKAFNAECDEIKLAMMTIGDTWYDIPASARAQCWRLFRDYFRLDVRNHSVMPPSPEADVLSGAGSELLAESTDLKETKVRKERKTKSAKPKRSRK